MTEFQTLALDLIVPSLTNPRKHFDVTRLTELTNSILASGVHQPILVRSLPGSRMGDTFRSRGDGAALPTHEIVCGERRYRACREAGLASIPCLVRELSDAQVLEIQIIENLQRDDLSALEEAEGFAQLLASTGISAEEIAAKIGKGRTYVYARLKLLDLSSECQAALRKGTIDASRALLIARIPDTKLQLKALTEATRTGYDGNVISVRALQHWLHANVMLRLDQATFKITDTRLVAAAGSCKTCPKRTGANPDLFSDVIGADICTDPACFNGKTGAHHDKLLAQAQSKGMRVIDGSDAKLICSNHRDGLKGYSPLSQLREDVAKGEPQTLRELLGKDAPAPVLIENPYTKELIEAVPTDEAQAMLLARGLIKALWPLGKENAERDLERLQKEAERATRHAVHDALFKATVQAVRNTDIAMAAELLGSSIFLRAWLTSALDEFDPEDVATALGYTLQEGEFEIDGVGMYIRACEPSELRRAAVILMAWQDSHITYADHVPLVLNNLVELLDVPAKQLSKKAAADVRATFAERLSQAKESIEAKKAPVPKAPLPPAATVPAAVAKAPRKVNPKLSAEQAKEGIAEAMQGMEPAQTPAPVPVVSIKKVAIPYRGPNGETWSGRGLKPRWVTHYVANGGQIEDLQVAA